MADMHLMSERAHGNSRETRRIYQETFPNRQLPSHQTFTAIDRRLTRELPKVARGKFNRTSLISKIRV